MSKKDKSNYTISIDEYADFAERVTVSNLIEQYNYFKNGLPIPFVSYDPEIEKKHVKKMLKALKRVIKYYGGSVNND